VKFDSFRIDQRQVPVRLQTAAFFVSRTGAPVRQLPMTTCSLSSDGFGISNSWFLAVVTMTSS
jgi:hypothetical protein